MIPSPDPRLPAHVVLPEPRGAASAAEELRYGLGDPGVATTRSLGAVVLHADDWLLTLPQLQELRGMLEERALHLERLVSRRRETLVAAAALGVVAEWPAQQEGGNATADHRAAEPHQARQPAWGEAPLTIHRGTLRSGDHLQTKRSVLLIGDANPGSRITAGGDVLVWGRLRGVAHAGADGDGAARIMALQLRPLQLRIAEAVARGPAEAPMEGMAEMAHLVAGEIRIDPAPPGWP